VRLSLGLIIWSLVNLLAKPRAKLRAKPLVKWLEQRRLLVKRLPLVLKQEIWLGLRHLLGLRLLRAQR
jgi:hypothetical protein